jgi:hypothetical protein
MLYLVLAASVMSPVCVSAACTFQSSMRSWSLTHKRAPSSSVVEKVYLPAAVDKIDPVHRTLNRSAPTPVIGEPGQVKSMEGSMRLPREVSKAMPSKYSPSSPPGAPAGDNRFAEGMGLSPPRSTVVTAGLSQRMP